MSVSALSNTTYSTTSSSTSTSSTSTLDKDAFLSLLVTELQNQDPLNPMDESDSIAQLAQFSALEQMQQVKESQTTLQAISMIGSTIDYTDDDGNTQTGTVTSVTIDNGTPLLGIGSTTVDIDQVTKIYPS